MLFRDLDGRVDRRSSPCQVKALKTSQVAASSLGSGNVGGESRNLDGRVGRSEAVQPHGLLLTFQLVMVHNESTIQWGR